MAFLAPSRTTMVSLSYFVNPISTYNSFMVKWLDTKGMELAIRWFDQLFEICLEGDYVEVIEEINVA